jgi:glycosyltransferase involved in cell wall biosynthesis
MKIKLGIVVPCYNEEEVLPLSAKELIAFYQRMVQCEKISSDSKILFVDDGSTDRTWDIICKLHKEYSCIDGLKLAKNSGHQNALLSGLLAVVDEIDAAISIDADLQDDVSAMEEMVDQYVAGCDIVYGVRNSRETDSVFKRGTALAFYKLMRLLGTDTVYNHADYRLMSRRAIYQLKRYEERNLFLRGIVTQIGYKTGYVYYKRAKRAAGKSKYPLKKMMTFAVDGITSFSIRPLVYISLIGFLCVFASIVAIAYIINGSLHGTLEPGWPSLIVSVWFLGGVQLLSLGMVGIYVGKTYIEVKKRPRYNVEERLSEEGQCDDEERK